MNTDKLNELLNENTSEPAKKGVWFLIQWSHTLGVDEHLNIGVGFVAGNGVISVKMLDDFSKVKIFLGEEFVFHAELACNVAEETITLHGADNISPQIRVIQKGFSQGDTVEQILGRLYDQVVTLGK